MTAIGPRNAKQEAQESLPGGFEAYVLEPSPPAINDGNYQADDPVTPGGRDPSVTRVTPTTAGDVTWDELAGRLPSIRDFASKHWLGAWSRLGALPGGYTTSVSSLGQLAFFVLAPARYEQQGKIGLRYTFRGLGTPFFGRDRQVRVEDEYLVVQDGDAAGGEAITTLSDAARMVGIEFLPTWGPTWRDPPAEPDPERPLAIDPEAVLACSNILGFGFSVLEQVRVEARPEETASRVQLWPEHFDAAVEIGEEKEGRRAAFGVSPGYAAHAEPFVYVSPWSKDGLGDPYWNADFFGGSILRYSDLLTVEDQRGTALEFLRKGLEILRAR